MPLNVRLDADIERVLNDLARRRGQTRSDVVREAIAQYGAAQRDAGDERRGPITVWADVIGIVDLGGTPRPGTTGERFTRLVREKRRARRAR
jgi:hypothetical protein